ncbi:MAG TPA: threonine ammonia-lyase, biosynthetic, partial [Burkholderiaceae bacterium]|nr:threonine ammonia-lyase, biosynthetic [Burkholderiaceae bacterium]
MIELADIEAAAQRLAGQILLTPCVESRTLSQITGAQVFLKFENLQYTASFKERGACNKLVQLTAEEGARGVIAMSAGNHAQGVAYHAQRLGLRAVIVMPRFTPGVKVERTRGFGAEIVLHGDTLDEARAHALSLAAQQQLVFVHPYDDADIVAGQGTVGLEMLQDVPELDTLLVAVGGGGLIAGMAAYIKRLRPEIKIVGVEPEDADAMARSLCKGERITLPRVGIFADGVAVKKVGKETFRLAQLYVDEVIRVNNDAICAAIKDVFEDTRSILEPAGALSIAGMKAAIAGDKLKGKTLVAVASGANMNFDRLRYIAERAELGEKREAVLAVTIPETPGSFKSFCGLLGARNIT